LSLGPGLNGGNRDAIEAFDRVKVVGRRKEIDVCGKKSVGVEISRDKDLARV